MIKVKNIQQMLSDEGFCITRFDGDSMFPFLNKNTDELLISTIKTKLAVGDIVLFKSKGSFILHRIVSKHLVGFVTKGDNNSAVDGIISKGRIIGKLEGYWRDGDYSQVYTTKFNAEIAGIPVLIQASEKQKEICKEYLSLGGKSKSNVIYLDRNIQHADENNFSVNSQQTVLESFRLFNQLGEHLYNYDAFYLHAAAVKLGEKAYVFIGPPGVGKSTHIRFLKETFKDEITIINGDKPIIRKFNSSYYVYGTPWCGKEQWNTNVKVPLGGIVVFDRANSQDQFSKIEKIDGIEAFDYIISQVFMPDNPAGREHTLSLCNEAFSSASIYRLWATKSVSAAQLSYMTLSGKQVQIDRQ